MTNQKFYAIPSFRLTVSQNEAFNAIGHALKHRQIDFFMAVELSDQVKAEQVDTVLGFLYKLTGKPVKLTDLLADSDEPN